MYFLIKTTISALLIALISETAKRSPAFAALIASLPIVSLLSMIWLWRDTHDTARIADHAEATFWYVLPSLPMFLVLPALLRRGLGFWPAMAAAVVLTVALYAITVSVLRRFGISLA